MKNLIDTSDRRILFLALSGIGNLIMQLPAIEALKKAHPTWHITVWVAPRGTKEIAESQSYIDEVLEMPFSPPYQGGAGGGLFRYVQNILTLRRHHFDIGVVLSPGQLLKSAAYLALAGIPIRIGHTYPFRSNVHSGFLLTDSIDELPEAHDIEQNLKLLDLVNIHTASVPYYSIQIPKQNESEANGFLSSTSYKLQAISYVGIHPGSAPNFEFKRWPLERFAEVAKALIQKDSNIQILVFGGPSEQEQNKKLVEMINASSIPSPVLGEGEDEGKSIATNAPHPNPLPQRERGATGNHPAVVVNTSLLTTAALMQKCRFVLANDSGLMHLSAAVGTPTLGLLGPTDEKQTGPRGSKSYTLRAPGTTPVYNTEHNHEFSQQPHDSMLAITPQIVLDKIEELGL